MHFNKQVDAIVATAAFGASCSTFWYMEESVGHDFEGFPELLDVAPGRTLWGYPPHSVGVVLNGREIGFLMSYGALLERHFSSLSSRSSF
jgi:hypothetical protein